MNEKDIAEIRRRFRPDKTNIPVVCGCYVNEKKEILAEFSQSLSILSVEESEEILTVLKKTLSGTLGKNLINVGFSTQQVTSGEEYKLLSELKSTALKDESVLHKFYARVIDSISFESNYMILLAYDTYDVPSYSKDGEKEDSSTVFSYIICSVCPIKITKPALSFQLGENRLRSLTSDWVISPPEIGFMFPAFDHRATNIYEALYYTRNTKESRDSFTDAIFNAELPMPAAAQKETFEGILGEAIADDCSYDLVQAVHGQICELIEEHKASREPEPLVLDKNAVSHVLSSCGAPEDKITAFGEKFDAEFGAGAEISPKNIVNAKRFEVTTPDITIKVNPERRDLIETRIIDGTKYILVRADGGVEVNGVNISIN